MKTTTTFIARRPRSQELLWALPFLAPWLLGGSLLLFVAACESTRANPDDDVPEEKPDQEIITGELQSDFLELGPAAGVQWLSFYPDDYLEYPELFEGLDADQRRRTRLAPREGANKVLLKFDLPAGAKIKPVDWYGTECVAIDLPDAKGFTVALTEKARTEFRAVKPELWAFEFACHIMRAAIGKRGYRDGVETKPGNGGSRGLSGPDWGPNKGYVEPSEADRTTYGAVVLRAGSDEFVALVECRNMDSKGADRLLTKTHIEGLAKIVNSISVVRELALEGSPKHQCTSSIEDLKAGVVAYEKGGLRLALPEGWELRKSGGSSTVEIHGGGAKPLALIRKLAPKNGSFKTRVGADTVFSRRKARTDGFFGAGRALTEQEPFVVAFDYRDRSAEQVALCVIATGNELLTVEIIGTGVIEGEARRKLRDACLEMLAKAEVSAIVRNRVPDLNELVGWKPKE